MNIQREQREIAILSTLAQLDYLSRSQIQRLHNLGTYRNTSRVLNEMKDYLSGFRDNEKIYYLNKEGRLRVGCAKVRTKSLQIEHFLMRNELYIHLGQPADWRNEMKLKGGGVTIICDAMYHTNKYHFVEVDRIQKMSKNRDKIRRYKKLMATGFSVDPEIIWITTTEHRRYQLKKECDGLNARIYTIEDLR